MPHRSRLVVWVTRLRYRGGVPFLGCPDDSVLALLGQEGGTRARVTLAIMYNEDRHRFGGTWGGKNSSFHHNLFACNTGRNPSIGMARSTESS